jgi:hypothetical protein
MYNLYAVRYVYIHTFSQYRDAGQAKEVKKKLGQQWKPRVKVSPALA